jgi:hypothetical protein
MARRQFIGPAVDERKRARRDPDEFHEALDRLLGCVRNPPELPTLRSELHEALDRIVTFGFENGDGFDHPVVMKTIHEIALSNLWIEKNSRRS